MHLHIWRIMLSYFCFFSHERSPVYVNNGECLNATGYDGRSVHVLVHDINIVLQFGCFNHSDPEHF